MKKCLILGANRTKFGFGKALIDAFEKDNFFVREINRSNVNLSSKHALSSSIAENKFDVIVVNAFDVSIPDLQLEIFKQLFLRFRKDNLTIVVVGSMAHFSRSQNVYAVAKRNLYQYFMDTGKDVGSYSCKLLMIDPGSMENMLSHISGQINYLGLEESAEMLVKLTTYNFKFMSLALVGNNLRE